MHTKCDKYDTLVWLLFFILLSTGSGRHSDAAHEINLIGCCVLLKVVPKNVPHSGSSQMLSVDWHRSKRCIYFNFFFKLIVNTEISSNQLYLASYFFKTHRKHRN